MSAITLNAQEYDLTKDIEDEYVDLFVLESDDSLMSEFRDFAIELFKSGKQLSDTIWENMDKNMVGVCLYAEDDSTGKRQVSFNLYALDYKDDRITDFHKRIYFGEGSEKISNFYVKCNNETETKLLNNAVDSYLLKDSIPFGNAAYEFAKDYVNDREDFDKMFPSDSISSIVMGNTYSYIRQNGNYLIQIQSFPEPDWNVSTDKVYATQKYLNNWVSITVFIIDESSGKAYDLVFE
jgi:hypothetical protein